MGKTEKCTLLMKLNIREPGHRVPNQQSRDKWTFEDLADFVTVRLSPKVSRCKGDQRFSTPSINSKSISESKSQVPCQSSEQGWAVHWQERTQYNEIRRRVETHKIENNKTGQAGRRRRKKNTQMKQQNQEKSESR